MRQPGNRSIPIIRTDGRGAALSVRVGVLLLFGLAALAGALAWADPWGWRQDPVEGDDPLPPRIPPPDPRLTYDGPFRNVRPDVKYVGDATCADCHPLKCETYHEHPMGRSMAPVAELADEQRYDESVNNPFRALSTLFRVERRGDRVWHIARRSSPGGDAEASAEAHYAVGSASSGRSYFTVRDGFVYQTPVSWFAQVGKWDLSPGFREVYLRPVLHECLFCHSNGVRPVEGTLNRYEEPLFGPLTPGPSPPRGEGRMTGMAVGCERCHGPGELHARERRQQLPFKGHIDHTIVNPAHLPPDLREHVCQQCHLEGKARVLRRGRGLFDYRPGLPLYEFWSIYVLARQKDGPDHAVSHVEQMYASKCFQASKGALGCATCHDPHEYPRPENRVSFYRQRCLDCHQEQHPCVEDPAARREKGDNCIDCHMPRDPTADIAHTAATDHRVPRVPGKIVFQGERRSAPPDTPLVNFHREGLGGEHADAARDLGLALVKWAARIDGREREEWMQTAVRLLEQAEAKDPYDVPVPLRRGRALALLKRPKDALGAFEKALKVAPRHEEALRGAARACANLKRYDQSEEYFRRLLAVSPHGPEDRVYYAATLALQSKYGEAVEESRRAIDLNPLQAEPRVLLAYCYRKLGDYARARAESEKGEALRTPGSEQFRRTFMELAQ